MIEKRAASLFGAQEASLLKRCDCRADGMAVDAEPGGQCCFCWKLVIGSQSGENRLPDLVCDLPPQSDTGPSLHSLQNGNPFVVSQARHTGRLSVA